MSVFALPAPPLPRVLVRLDTGSGFRWYSDGRYVDAASNTVAQARLGKRISFERTVNTAYWSGNGRATASLGAIELINSDGALDELLGLPLRDKVIQIYLGTEATAVSSLTLVARGIVENVESDGESAIRIVVGDASRELEKPLQTELIPSGAFVGQPYPVTIGFCLSVPALHTEAPTLRFGLHDSAAAGRALTIVQFVSDSGVTLTGGTQWNAYNTAPSFGFSLNQATSGRILANVIGPGPNAGFNNATLNGVVRYLLETRLGWAGSRVDAAGYSALDVEMGTPRFGRHVSNPVTYAQVLDELADSIGGWWRIDLSGVLRMDRLRLPSGTPVLELTRNHLDGEVDIKFDDAPGMTNIVAGGRNWYPLSESEQAGSVRDTAAGVELRKEYRFLASFSVHAAYARNAASWGASTSQGISSIGMPTLLSNTTSTSNEAAARAGLWAAPKWWYELPVLLDAVAAATLAGGAVVRLTLARHGLDAGRLLRVIKVRGELGSSRVELVLWGDGPTTGGGSGAKE